MRRWLACVGLSALLLWSCDEESERSTSERTGEPQAAADDTPRNRQASCTPGPGTQLALREVVAGLQRPLFVTAAPEDDERLFIVEQRGRIRVFKGGALLKTDFLDLSSRVSQSGNERGLLGMAFHPAYTDNGRFFVNYTAAGDGRTVIAEYRVSEGNADVANTTERRILTVNQPYSNHNAGMLAFGPRDGYLYIGLGDGGAGGDPEGNGQDDTTLLASMLRIDVGGSQPYAIPADNPYTESSGGAGEPRPELWAIGLRNPWRYSFDRDTGDLYIGDVGQGRREEIHIQPASSNGGENYGWNVMEGTECYESSSCDRSTFEPPGIDYSHDDGCSITGGYVYRGGCIPDIQGWYIYADYCSNRVWKLEYEAGRVSNVAELTDDLSSQQIDGISSFGEDASGELYLTDLSGGKVWKIVREGT